MLQLLLLQNVQEETETEAKNAWRVISLSCRMTEMMLSELKNKKLVQETALTLFHKRESSLSSFGEKVGAKGRKKDSYLL